MKESRYLSITDAKYLLETVRNSEIETAVWIQLFTGLRIGEVQALKWEDIDFKQGGYGKLLVAGTYVRKEKRFKDSSKGGEQHRINLPIELSGYLLDLSRRSQTIYVASKHPTEFLSYYKYYTALKRVCKSAGIPWVATHGLRHTTSEIYLAHGASYDDMKNLFAHSATSVTHRYLHDHGSGLQKVANVIRLFPNSEREIEHSQNFTKSENLANS